MSVLKRMRVRSGAASGPADALTVRRLSAMRRAHWAVWLAAALCATACVDDDTGLGDEDGGGQTDGDLTPQDDRGVIPDARPDRRMDASTCVPREGDPPGQEICNAIDDDCDGTPDEGFRLGESCAVGEGACAANGRIVCAPDGTARCDAVAGAPAAAELCNTLDDDCDGTTDEGFVLGEACQETDGACTSTGRMACTADGTGVACDAPPAVATEERCDNLDNDCDGNIDEGIEEGALCEAGVGQCRRGGFVQCGPDGTVTCTAREGMPREEICDSFDNDCDGTADEGFGAAFCEVGVGACRREGNETCNAQGVVGCHIEQGVPEVESCNGIDDDCDGSVDEDYAEQLGQACNSGLGVCARPGVFRCEAADGGGGGYRFEGIAQDLAVADIERGGFVQCHLDNYGNDRTSIRDILDRCNDEVLLMGCRPTGADTLTLAAMGDRAFVLADMGQEINPTNVHNGVNWYFSDQYSWGFAPPGVELSRNSCDTGEDQGQLRMCWHTGNGNINQGYRCGNNYPFNDFERVVYQKASGPGIECSGEAAAVAVVEQCNDLDDDCDGNVDEEIPGVGEQCEENVGLCQRGETACQPDGSIACRGIDIEPSPERCNRIDDDCNGVIDDVPGLGDACQVGEGVCASDGQLACGEFEYLPLTGIVDNVAEADLIRQGFEPCYEGTFADFDAIEPILAACNGEALFIGCGQPAPGVFKIGAMGERDFVLLDNGREPSPINVHNGVNWYFNDSHSWGFSPPGLPLARNSCDTEGAEGEHRMCWHTGEASLNFGYRCGTNTNAGPDVRRAVWHRPLAGGLVCEAPAGVAEPTDERCDGLDNDCDGLTDEGLPGVGVVCQDGVGLCQRGETQCDENGEIICAAFDIEPSHETCNGIDDDCNGAVDDVAGVGEACADGAGQCAVEGVLACGDRVALPLNGIRQNITEATLRANGFEPCFRGRFDGNENIDQVLRACDGAVLFMGCGEPQPGTFQLGAMGERDFVLLDNGQQPSPVNVHNGVNWYFNDSYSWGFSPVGLPLARNSCDTENAQGDQRMCWHTGGGSLNFGYRCGNNSNAGPDVRREVWQQRLRDGLVCQSPGGNPEPVAEACNGLDDDCDGNADEDFGLGEACTAGVGACQARGQVLCDANGEVGCNARPGVPGEEVCNGIDDDCDGRLDEGLMCPFFASCQAALQAGNNRSGVFPILDANGGVNNLWCDMVTDGGGWTLVASTAGTTLDDFGMAYYADLATLAPAGANAAVFNGVNLGDRSDMRFACRLGRGAAADPMTVDLSFYDVSWYSEIRAAANDAASCFNDSGNPDQPVPSRQNNLTGERLAVGTRYMAGELVGEDFCGDDGDFTVDYNDRGMDSNQQDGTDWGEDDGSQKCGRDSGDGQWFIFVRESLAR